MSCLCIYVCASVGSANNKKAGIDRDTTIEL